MTRILAILAIFTTSTAGHAGPGGLADGTYDGFNCAAPVSDQRIVLRGNELSFYETNCLLSNPQGLRGLTGPVLVDATCTGEGEGWQTRYIMLQTNDGGITLMGEGFAEKYVRCP